MTNYKEKFITRVEKVVDSVTCDVCKKIVDRGLELQEMYPLRFTGGYDSVFGDGAQVECDICQHCMKNILGKYFRIIL